MNQICAPCTCPPVGATDGTGTRVPSPACVVHGSAQFARAHGGAAALAKITQRFHDERKKQGRVPVSVEIKLEELGMIVAEREELLRLARKELGRVHGLHRGWDETDAYIARQLLGMP